MAEKQAVPALENRPKIPSYCECYYKAYLTLQGSKTIGMAVSQIPYSEVRLFAHDYGFDAYELFEVICLVESLLCEEDKK